MNFQRNDDQQRQPPQQQQQQQRANDDRDYEFRQNSSTSSLLQRDEHDQRARLNLNDREHIKSDFKAGDNLPQQRNHNDDEFRQNSSASSLLQRDEHDQRARLNLDDREHIKSDFKAGDNLPQRRPPRQQDQQQQQQQQQQQVQGYEGTRPNEPFGEIKSRQIQNRQVGQAKRNKNNASLLQRDEHDQRARLDLKEQYPSSGTTMSSRSESLTPKKVARDDPDQQARLDLQDQVLNFQSGGALNFKKSKKAATTATTGKSSSDESLTPKQVARDDPDQPARLDLQGQVLNFQSATTTTTGKSSSDRDRIQGIYRKWCRDYGKQPYNEEEEEGGGKRLETFAKNLRAMEEYETATGQSVSLNEFSDLSAQEVNAMKEAEEAPMRSSSSGSSTTTTTSSTSSSPEVAQREARLRAEEEARKNAEGEARRLEAENARIRAETGAKVAAEEEAERMEIERIRAENEARVTAEEEAERMEIERIRAENEARVTAEEEAERIEIERVRNAYGNWCSKYGKKFDEERVNLFAANFYKMEDYQKASGKAMELNEHSDLTENEYKLVQQQQAKAEEERIKAEAKVEEERIKAEVEARVRQEEEERTRKQVEKEMRERVEAQTRIQVGREKLETFEENARRKYERLEQSLFDLNAVYKELTKSDSTVSGSDSSISKNKKNKVRYAYKEWCKFYDKEYDSSRENVFASNAKKVEAYYETSGVSMKLNGYADRTVEEYREVQKRKDLALAAEMSSAKGPTKESSTPVSFSDANKHRSGGQSDLKRIRNAYAEWCIIHGKDYDEVRFANFANNKRQMEKYQKSTGKEVELNEFSDLTVEEYAQMMKNKATDDEDESPSSTSSRPPPPQAGIPRGTGLIRESGLIRVSGDESDKARNTPDISPEAPSPGSSRREPAVPSPGGSRKEPPVPQAVPQDAPQGFKTSGVEISDASESQAELAQRLISFGPEEPSMAPEAAGGDNFLMKEEVNMRDVSIGKSIDLYKNKFPENVVVAYKEFCQKHGKAFDQSRLANFQYSFLAAQSFGSRMELNQYADLSQEEFMEMKNTGGAQIEPPKVERQAPKEQQGRVGVAQARTQPNAPPTVQTNSPDLKKAPYKKPKIVFSEESLDTAKKFPSPAELYKIKMEDDMRKEQEEEERIVREAEEEYARSTQTNAPPTDQTNSPDMKKAPYKKPQIVFSEESLDTAKKFPSPAELYKLKMEEDMRKEQEEEERIVREAEEEYSRSIRDEEEANAGADEKAAADAKRQSDEDGRRKAADEARIQAEKFAKRKAEDEAEARWKAETVAKAAKLRAQVEAEVRAELEAERRVEEAARLKIEEGARLKAYRKRERIKAEAETQIILEEEARRREAEVARERAEEERQKAEANARLKAAMNIYEQGPKFNTKRGTFSELNQTVFERSFASSDSKQAEELLAVSIVSRACNCGNNEEDRFLFLASKLIIASK
jgi:hypothetical protein